MVIITLVLCRYAGATLEGRTLAIDIGAGMPQLLTLQGAVLVINKFQLGFSYGLIPSNNFLGPDIDLPANEVTLANGQSYTVRPKASVGLSSMMPFIRYFPSQTNFYVQLGWALFKTKINVHGNFQELSGNVIDDALVSGVATLTQSLPTLSIGHVFTTNIYFFNISLGASFFGTLYTDFGLAGVLPEAMGGNAGNQVALGELKKRMDIEINKAFDEHKAKILFIPSVLVSFGIIL
ncbi:MAG: hypothetical protein HY537_09715 [Deltaproteobacteria bacterium]|nr:hypothetical protein [Deltaproteobacteria bacterium]